jgi:hypothetical protein
MMSPTEKAVIDELVRRTGALLNRCEELGLTWVAVDLSVAIDRLSALEKLPEVKKH